MIGFLRRLFFELQPKLVPPGNSVAFLHWGIPNDDEGKRLVQRVRPGNLHHVLDSNHLLFFCCLLLSFSAVNFCVLPYPRSSIPVFDCCVRFFF